MATKKLHSRDVLNARDGVLRIVAVADTHGHPHPKAHACIEGLRPDAILHGGDIGDLAVLDGLSKIAPVLAVRGNIDGHAATLPDTRTIDVFDGDAVLATLLLVHIAVYGPKLRADVIRQATAQDVSLVVCGHSHVPFMGRDRGIAVFNPGSIGPRRFALPIVFGVIEISRERVSLEHIDCETGMVWQAPNRRPPA